MVASLSLRLLLVRPYKQDDTFVERMTAAGAEVHRCPVMEIVPIPESLEREIIKSRILDFDHYQIAIFVSPTAARLGLDWLEDYWPMLPAGVRFYAVGNSTADVLRERGIPVEVPSASADSEGLLELPSLQMVDGEKGLILAGKGGRNLLADELTRRGVRMDRCELYERQPSDAYVETIESLLVEQRIDLVVAHSGELLKDLLQLLHPDKLQQLLVLPVLVPGERVAELARQSGFQEVLAASSALPEDMVSAIFEWYSTAIDPLRAQDGVTGRGDGQSPYGKLRNGASE
jgi:uroporphyrinogen-III synthase